MSSKHLIQQAKKAFQAEDYGACLSAACAVVEADESSVQGWMFIAKSAFHLRSESESYLTKCADAYERAAALEPDKPLPWKGLLEVYDAMNAGNKKEAPLENLIRITKANGKQDKSRAFGVELARCARTNGNFSSAIRAWESVLCEGWDPTETEIDALGISSLLDVLMEACKVCQEALQKTADSTQADSLQSKACTQSWQEKSALRDELELCLSGYALLLKTRTLGLVQAECDASINEERVRNAARICREIVRWFRYAAPPIEVYFTLHMLLSGDGLCVEREQLLDDIWEIHDSNRVINVQKGILMARKGKYTEACELLRTGLSRHSSESWRAWLVFSQLLIVDGPTRNVREGLQAVEQARNVFEAQCKVFHLPVFRDRTTSARIAAELLTWKGRAYGSMADIQSSEECLSAALREEPAFEDAVVALVRLKLSNSLHDEARETLEKYFPSTNSTKPRSNQVLVCYAQLQCETNALDDAENTLRLLVSPTSTENSEALFLTGLVHWQRGGQHRKDKTLCLNAFLRAAKLNPFLPRVFTLIGKYYETIECDTLRAIKCYVKANTLHPLDEEAGRSLVRLFRLHEKDTRREKNLLEKSIEGNKRAKWAWLELAQFHLNQSICEDGRQESLSLMRSAECMHEVLRIDPVNEAHWVSLAHVYHKQGKLMAARSAYLKALDMIQTPHSDQDCRLRTIWTELGRLERSMGMCSDALSRMRMIFHDHSVEYLEEARIALASYLVYGNVLFDQAKSFHIGGMYGKATENIKVAAKVLETAVKCCCQHLKHSTTTSNTSVAASVFKLLGDVHSFAFYVSPSDYGERDGTAWIEFVARGKTWYEKALEKECELADTTHNQDKLYYDIAVNIFYVMEMHRCVNPKRKGDVEQEKEELRNEGLRVTRKALKKLPESPFLWNALACFDVRPEIQFYAFSRALQLESMEDSWRNLGRLLIEKKHMDLGREAYLQVHSINPHSASLWVGLGLVLLADNVCVCESYEEVVSNFQCALEIDLNPDALFNHALASVLSSQGLKLAQFTIHKFTELNPFSAVAFNVYGVILMRNGLYTRALDCFRRSKELLTEHCAESDESELLRCIEANIAIALLRVNPKASLEQFSNSPALKNAVQNGTLYERLGHIQALYANQKLKESMIALQHLVRDKDMKLCADTQLALECLQLRLAYAIGKEKALDSPVVNAQTQNSHGTNSKLAPLIGAMQCLSGHNSSSWMKYLKGKDSSFVLRKCLEFSGEFNASKASILKHMYSSVGTDSALLVELVDLLWSCTSLDNKNVKRMQLAQRCLDIAQTNESRNDQYRSSLLQTACAVFSNAKDTKKAINVALKNVYVNANDGLGWLFLALSLWKSIVMAMASQQQDVVRSHVKLCGRVLDTVECVSSQLPSAQVQASFRSLRDMCKLVHCKLFTTGDELRQLEEMISRENPSIVALFRSTLADSSGGDLGLSAAKKHFINSVRECKTDRTTLKAADIMGLAVAFENENKFLSAKTCWKVLLKLSDCNEQKLLALLKLAVIERSLSAEKNPSNIKKCKSAAEKLLGPCPAGQLKADVDTFFSELII